MTTRQLHSSSLGTEMVTGAGSRAGGVAANAGLVGVARCATMALLARLCQNRAYEATLVLLRYCSAVDG